VNRDQESREPHLVAKRSQGAARIGKGPLGAKAVFRGIAITTMLPVPEVGEGTEGNITIDSGSVIHVCSPAFGQCSGHALRKDRNLQIHGAGGHNIKHHGQQQIDL